MSFVCKCMCFFCWHFSLTSGWDQEPDWEPVFVLPEKLAGLFVAADQSLFPPHAHDQVAYCQQWSDLALVHFCGNNFSREGVNRCAPFQFPCISMVTLTLSEGSIVCQMFYAFDGPNYIWKIL